MFDSLFFFVFLFFYNGVAQGTTTQNYLCFVSYYIVFKVLVESVFRVKQRATCNSTQPRQYLDVRGWERQRESSGLNMQYVAGWSLKLHKAHSLSPLLASDG